MPLDAEAYYSREEVRLEIAEFCRGRWAALEGAGEGQGRRFLRYWDARRQRPLTIGAPEDILRALRRFFWAKPRSFYGSANLYSSLESADRLEDPSSFTACTAVWDVDGPAEDPRPTLEAARILVEKLRELGVVKSVYLLWSGAGLHVRVHEGAFSGEIKARRNPLDLSYALVEHVLRLCRPQLASLLAAHPSLRVENLMDVKRVFTAPLSLHRQLDRAAVCLRPERLDDFELSWTNPASPRHDPSWREALAGEADRAADEALRHVTGYHASGPRTVLAAEPGAAPESPMPRVGRFQVMALLQAARYYILYGDLQRAQSFGLNRAIFYAWAKRAGARAAMGRAQRPLAKAPAKQEKAVRIGDEVAFVSDNGWFEIGRQEQRPEDYEREVVRRIEAAMPYEEAWRRALEYLKGFERSVLEGQRSFYEKVYAPVRDKFLA